MVLFHGSQQTWPSRAGLSVSKQSQVGEQAVIDKNMSGTPELEIATSSGAYADEYAYALPGECYPRM